MLRPTLLAVLLSAAVPTMVLAQTSQDLKNDEKTTGDVLVYGMGYSAQRFSPLTQINKQNVNRLVPAWGYSLADLQGGESFPIVKDGVIYITTHNSTAAVDALTGKQIWRTLHDYPPETLRVVCCGIVNRGAAMYEGLIIRALMDNRMIALDAKTGKDVWHVKSPEPVTHANGYSMTGAPLIVNGMVITGVAGAEFSHRGLLEAYDAKTGKHLWRTYTIPAKGEPGYDTWEGDSALTGGGSSWVTGTYDAELDLVYWGIGNPSPWNPRARKGDNLYTNSVIAIRPDTGKMVWHYQTTPHDPFDYDGVQTPVIATVNVGGSPRKVIIQAKKRLPLRARREGRKAGRGQFLWEGELGERYRQRNWASDRDGRVQRRSRRQECHGLALGFWSDELAEPGLQSADRLSLRQHPARRDDLRSARTAEARAREAVRQSVGEADCGDRRSQYSRLPQGG
jgi:alcohol dehydrogenase (cytochrome c)